MVQNVDKLDCTGLNCQSFMFLNVKLLVAFCFFVSSAALQHRTPPSLFTSFLTLNAYTLAALWLLWRGVTAIVWLPTAWQFRKAPHMERDREYTHT